MNEKTVVKRRAELELKIESLAYGGMGVAKKDEENEEKKERK